MFREITQICWTRVLALLSPRLVSMSGTALLGLTFPNSQAFGQQADVRAATQAQLFFKHHCVECHGPNAQEGKLRVDKLTPEFKSKTRASVWLKILNKLKSGEMPPQDSPRPPKVDTQRVSAWIEQSLLKADQEQQRKHGRVVLRRLNRVEYQNTINDLFGIKIDVKDLLPEDNSAHGFDNNGAALNISSVLLERYLEAADVALDAAIVTGQRPITSKKRYSYKNERRVKDHKSYKPVDDGLVFFSSGYSPTEINQFRASAAGYYRIRVSAYAYQSEEPIAFRVYGEYGGAKHLAGFYSANPKPTVVELTTRLGFHKTIRVVPFGTRLTKWNTAASEKGAGLAVQWVEIEGPIVDQWPPASLKRIFGDLSIEVTNREAMKRNRRLEPLREVVSLSPRRDAENILQRLLPKIFRRPVTPDQLAPYLQIILSRIESGYSFQQAVRVGLKAALCSPDFLFLPERSPALSSPTGALVTQALLDDFQLASRLSYFLWSTMPDDELLKLASQGKLHDVQTLLQQTERMLKDARAANFTENFVGQWLNLRDIDLTSPDGVLYPEYDELLRVSMVQETQRFFNELLTKNLSVLNFVDSDFAILNERLAKHYGIPDVRGLELRRVRLPADSRRGGVLTQASILKVTANGTNTSPVLRGVWVLDKILGQPVPPPPANVPAVEPDIRGATTIREQLGKHRQIASCASCHKNIDPAGFALESFDVIGGWRENYRSVGEGARVDVEVAGRRVRYRKGPPVEAADVLANGDRFENIDEFKSLLLKDKDQLARCVVEKLLTYSTGSGIQLSDRDDIDAIVSRVKQQNYGLRSIVNEIIQSDLFQSK